MLDFSRVRNKEITINDLAAALTLNDLRKLTDEMIDTQLKLIADCTDADVTFDPVDPQANDTFASGVVAGNLFANDSDADGVIVNGVLQTGNWRPVLVTAPARGTVVLNANGTFTYTPSPSACGADTFAYRISTGTWRDSGLPLSADSNTATVSVDPSCVRYQLLGLTAVPPATIRPVTAGGYDEMQWEYVSGTTPVDSGDVQYTITVKGPLPSGTVRTFTNAAPGTGNRLLYKPELKQWFFNLLTADGGTAWPAGTYEITISSSTPGYGSSQPWSLTVR